MELEDFKKMAESMGVPPDQIRVFLTFHHNLGDLVYFEETGLDDTIILCPQWLANVFR